MRNARPSLQTFFSRTVVLGVINNVDVKDSHEELKQHRRWDISLPKAGRLGKGTTVKPTFHGKNLQTHVFSAVFATLFLLSGITEYSVVTAVVLVIVN